MSDPNPMVFAAQCAAMSDDDLYAAFRSMKQEGQLTDYERALLDEAEIRGMLTASEVQSVQQQAT